MMRSVLKACYIGVIIGAAITVCAAAVPTANVSWVAPTQYDDNSPLAATDIAYYTVVACPGSEIPAAPGCLTQKVSPATAGAAPPTTLTGMPLVCGSYTISVTVTTTASAKYPNETSGPSTAVPLVTSVSCSPNPPSGVTATPGAG